MNDGKREVVALWFRKAESDLKNIENNLAAADIPVDTVCFHAQQAIEKYFKGALVWFDRDFGKTHDLVQLLGEIRPLIPELSDLEEALEQITGYAVEVRYPDSFYVPPLEEGKKAYDTAKKVKEAVLRVVLF